MSNKFMPKIRSLTFPNPNPNKDFLHHLSCQCTPPHSQFMHGGRKIKARMHVGIMLWLSPLFKLYDSHAHKKRRLCKVQVFPESLFPEHELPKS